MTLSPPGYNHQFMLRPYRGQWPQLDASVFVDQSAQVIGDVTIGPESSIWMNCVVRGDVHRIRIGAQSNIQDGTIVHVMRGTHPTTIGDRVTIGHGAIIHGCTLEDRVLVGMGAIVLNGAVVGSDSIVAAGTLVPEGMVIPPRSLVMGSPGRVRREVSEDEAAMILDLADRYVGYRLDYMESSPSAHPAAVNEGRG
jgi:carbonic anhydrase/acetyltransferase-like protein (isoleucine patch superfamily)